MPLKLVFVQNIHAKRDEAMPMEPCPTESHTGVQAEVHTNCDADVTLPATSENPENEVSNGFAIMIQIARAPFTSTHHVVL
jgi:hypothetical protein